jgi:cysteine rich repeat protein
MGKKMLVRQLAHAGLLAAAMLAPPGPAVAQSDAMALCKADIARLCPGVEPGGGRIVGCLKEHKMEVSVGCAKAI